MKILRRFLLLALVVPALQLNAAPQSLQLADDARVDLSLTIYNGGFAVVKDVRETVLPAGLVEVEYQDVAREIEAPSVVVQSDPDSLTVLEQNYRYDLLNRDTLLERYVGRKLKYSRSVLQGNKFEKVLREGILLSANPEIVKFGDEIEISPEGTISLSYIPEGMSERPALMWLAENAVNGKLVLSTSYITGGLGWRADHVITLDEQSAKFSLVTWATVDNRSGLSWKDAGLRLVAGDVQRIQEQRESYRQETMARMTMDMAAPVPVEGLHEYYLYDIPRRTSLANQETKQLHLFEAAGVSYEKRYVLTSGVQMQPMVGQEQTRHPMTVITFENSTDNGLGVSLPAGNARMYLKSSDGNLQLAGEDRIGHTPSGERVDLTTGTAFDLVAERRQTEFRRVGDRSQDVSYEVVLRNRKDSAVTVEVRETLYGDWTVLQQSHEGERVDSTTLAFDVDIDAGEEQKITYTARIVR